MRETSPVQELQSVIRIKEKQVHIPISSPIKLPTLVVDEVYQEAFLVFSDSSRATFCKRFQRASLRLSNKKTPLMHPSVK